MKVLQIYKTSYPDSFGGIERFMTSLASATSKLGVDNTILTVSPSQNTRFEDSGLKVIREPTSFEIASCPFSLSMIKKFKALIAPYDVIHLHFPWPFAELLTLFLARPNQKICLTYHSDIVRQKYLKKIYQPFMQRFLKRCNRIVVTSPNLLNSSEDLASLKNKCDMISLGIDLNEYQTIDPQKIAFWRERVGDNFLLFIGQFRYYKGLHILLESLKETQIPAVLVGGGYLEPQLRQQAQQLNLKNILFAGSISGEDKGALLSLCKTLVLPSIHPSEAFGIVLLEAAAFKKPLISTELGTGTSYANIHEETGLVTTPNDSKQLSSAILKIYQDDSKATQMGEAAYSRLQNNFDIQKIAKQYVQFYQSLV